MYRTPEEEREYQNLSSEDKGRYDFEASQDPSLSHKQIIQMMGVNGWIKKTLKEGNGDIDVKKPEVKKSMLESVGDFLREKAPSVWRDVKDTFYQAISYLKNLIERGIDIIIGTVIDPVVDFLDDLFG